MANPPDWTNWQERLRQLAEGTPEGTWPDPNLQGLEDTIISRASVSASAWLLRLWLLLQGSVRTRDEDTFDDLLEASEDDPIDVDDVANQITRAQEIARRRVERSKTLPDKGDWIDVPSPPPPHRVSVPKPDKTAEWLARQSSASKMREWASGMREDVRWQVVQAIREGLNPSQLAERLEGRWERYGQNFQMIAVTEMSLAYNNATLSLLGDDYVVVPPIGDDRVCKSCKRWLEGKVFWVAPAPIEDATKQENEQYVWVGKSNIGRKEADWIPCIPLHPRCRHVFVRYRGGDPYSYRAKQKI